MGVYREGRNTIAVLIIKEIFLLTLKAILSRTKSWIKQLGLTYGSIDCD